MTIISPKLNTRVLYYSKKRKRFNMSNPQTFEEKLLTLKLNNYNHNPLVKQCADKYAVRGFIKEKGLEELLNELYGVYESPEDIPWDELPNQFALKLNVGCGCNYICKDKSSADKTKVYERAKKWLKNNYWLGYAEIQYKNVPKKLLVEKYLSSADGTVPADYKIYCFNGNPTAILFIYFRFTGEMNVGFFDVDWNYLGIEHNKKKKFRDFAAENMPSAPCALKKMINASRVLSKDFPFVRVDFFEIDGKAVFSELTFTPAGGFEPSQVNVNGKTMAELLQL